MGLTRWKSSTSVRLDCRRHMEFEYDQVRFLSMLFSASPIEESDEPVDWRVPQIEGLKLSIPAADRGEFASPHEVAGFFKSWST